MPWPRESCALPRTPDSGISTSLMVVTSSTNSTSHRISAVVPVYRAPKELNRLVNDLNDLRVDSETKYGNTFIVTEIVLVHDGGLEETRPLIRELARRFEQVRVIWLSRNFGQHPATLAGMSATSGEWIVTLDEDGQFPPNQIGDLLDHALSAKSPIVYGQPAVHSGHQLWRRIGSFAARKLFRMLAGSAGGVEFSSFRLIMGELGRSVSAYCGSETYLDVALTWVSSRASSIRLPYTSNSESSSYSINRLAAHFLRLVLTSGTRPMRIFAILGTLTASSGFVLAALLVYRRLVLGFPAGFTSTLSLLLILVGLVLFGLSILTEYVGLTVRAAIGKPLFLVISDPSKSPLYRDTDSSQL